MEIENRSEAGEAQNIADTTYVPSNDSLLDYRHTQQMNEKWVQIWEMHILLHLIDSQ